MAESASAVEKQNSASSQWITETTMVPEKVKGGEDFGSGSSERASQERGTKSCAGTATSGNKSTTEPARTSNPKDSIGSDKVPISKIPPVAILHEAMAMGNGADKYTAFNWRGNAVQADIYIDAALRHILAWFDGEETASDSGVHHLGHARASLGILLDAQATGNLIDNRPKGGTTAKLLDELNSTRKAYRAKMKEPKG